MIQPYYWLLEQLYNKPYKSFKRTLKSIVARLKNEDQN